MSHNAATCGPVVTTPLFTLEERVAMVEAECAAIIAKTGGEIVVHPFENLLIDCARDVGATVIVRGLRAVADFEYEYQMAGMNQQLDHSIETVFLMADVSLQPIASKLVKEIALFGGEIRKFVPATVRDEVIALGEREVPIAREIYIERRQRMLGLLKNVKGVSCTPPDGAFYVFANVSGLMGLKTPSGKTIETDTDLVSFVLEDEGVATVGGAAYGMSPYIRLSFASSMDVIEDGCLRFQRSCEKLR